MVGRVECSLSLWVVFTVFLTCLSDRPRLALPIYTVYLLVSSIGKKTRFFDKKAELILMRFHQPYTHEAKPFEALFFQDSSNNFCKKFEFIVADKL